MLGRGEMSAAGAGGGKIHPLFGLMARLLSKSVELVDVQNDRSKNTSQKSTLLISFVVVQNFSRKCKILHAAV